MTRAPSIGFPSPSRTTPLNSSPRGLFVSTSRTLLQEPDERSSSLNDNCVTQKSQQVNRTTTCLVSSGLQRQLCVTDSIIVLIG